MTNFTSMIFYFSRDTVFFCLFTASSSHNTILEEYNTPLPRPFLLQACLMHEWCKVYLSNSSNDLKSATNILNINLKKEF